VNEVKEENEVKEKEETKGEVGRKNQNLQLLLLSFIQHLTSFQKLMTID